MASGTDDLVGMVIFAKVAASDWVVALSTALYVILTAVLVQIGLRQSRHAEVALIGELTARWQSMSLDWSRSLMIARGPGDYYNIANPTDTAKYTSILARWAALDEEGVPDLSSEYWARRDALINERREFEQSATSILEFLASVSLLVLSGRLSGSGAYAVIGPQIVRSGGSLRELMPYVEQTGEVVATGDVNTMPGSIAGWGTYRPGVIRRVFVLTDLLWAVAVGLGDLSKYEVGGAADAKAARTRSACRSRLRTEVLRVNGPWFGKFRDWKLGRTLRQAEWKSKKNRRGVARDEAATTRANWSG